MCEPARERYRLWELEGLLTKYAGLRIEPTSDADLVLSGPMGFRVTGPKGERIDDEYSVEIRVSQRFPAVTPTAYETDGRIPWDYHKLEGNFLCLGAPTALRMRLSMSPSLLTFVDEFVVPYLAGYTHFARTGMMLFGELAHGTQGIREYLAELFHSRTSQRAEEFLRLASLKKRSANKLPCPCGSGKRLGKCHNRIVNAHRKKLGRTWFAVEYERTLRQFPESLRREQSWW